MVYGNADLVTLQEGRYCSHEVGTADCCLFLVLQPKLAQMLAAQVLCRSVFSAPLSTTLCPAVSD